MLSLIAAMTKKRVIGLDNTVPWHIPDELRNFKHITMGHAVIMGRKTYDIIGSPLSMRHNIVLSNSLSSIDNVTVMNNLEEAISEGELFSSEVFIIGGQKLYEDTIDIADRMYLSIIKKDYQGNKFFPEFDERNWKIMEYLRFHEFDFFKYDRR